MSIEKVSWEVFALFGLKGTETISNALIFVDDLEKQCKLFSKMPCADKIIVQVCILRIRKIEQIEKSRENFVK